MVIRYDASGCNYSFVRVAVGETRRTVTIAVYDRYEPLPKGVACAAQARIAGATVRLHAPLDGRGLLHAPVNAIP